MTIFCALSQVVDHHTLVGCYCHTHLIDARIVSLHFTHSKADQHCTDTYHNRQFYSVISSQGTGSNKIKMVVVGLGGRKKYYLIPKLQLGETLEFYNQNSDGQNRGKKPNDFK